MKYVYKYKITLIKSAFLFHRDHKKYSKSTFDELLDVEAKHVIDDFIKQCAKNSNISLIPNCPEPSSENTLLD